MGDRLQEKPLWAANKAVYSSLISRCHDREIAESFFSSLTRRVFATVKDRFDYPKDSSRSEVMRKYCLVFEHDRAGRLVEAYEFERLRIPRDRFRPELLDAAVGICKSAC
jgi:isocitrate dehydrogenase kinase/phosphatase